MYVLLQHEDGRYSLGLSQGTEVGSCMTIDVLPDASVDDWAEAVAATLRGQGYAGEAVLLAIASRHCLVGAITLARPQEARDRNRLAFQLEEQLPWAAEEVASDFSLEFPHGLGIAVELEPVQRRVEALVAQGIPVQSVTPTALLGMQELLRTDTLDIAQRLILWQREEGVDWIVLRGERLHDWRRLAADEQAIARELAFAELVGESFAEVLLYGFEHAQVACLKPRSRFAMRAMETLDEAPDTPVFRGGAQVLNGTRRPWIELRQGPLAASDRYGPLRNELRLFTASLAVLLVALTASLFYRAHTFEGEAAKLQQEQEVVFQELLPGQAIPVGVRSRLESEVAKLAGLTGQSAEIPAHVPTLSLLEQLLAALPTDLRLRLLEVRLEEGRLYLDGEVRTHGDAEAVATALRSGGFTLDAPQSEQLASEGVSMRINGTAATPIADKKAEARR